MTSWPFGDLSLFTQNNCRHVSSCQHSKYGKFSFPCTIGVGHLFKESDESIFALVEDVPMKVEVKQEVKVEKTDERDRAAATGGATAAKPPPEKKPKLMR